MWHFGVGMGRARLSRAAVIAATTAATAADSSSDGISASSISSSGKQIAIQSLESLRTFCTTFHGEEQGAAAGSGGSNYYASYNHPVAALCTIASAILADAVRDARIKAF